MKASRAAMRTRFERDGYLVVPGLLTDGECDELKTEARRVLDEYARPGASVHVHVAAVSPRFYKLAGDARLVRALRPVMPHGVMFLSDKIVYKSPEKTFPTPWHYDCFYWRNTRPKLSVWIPLDDVSAENGTLKVIPGSHRRTWHMSKMGQPSGDFQNAIDNADWKENDAVVCELKRGGAIIFSDRLVHASTANTAARDRYVIIGTYHAPAADEAFDLDFPARRVLVPGNDESTV